MKTGGPESTTASTVCSRPTTCNWISDDFADEYNGRCVVIGHPIKAKLGANECCTVKCVFTLLWSSHSPIQTPCCTDVTRVALPKRAIYNRVNSPVHLTGFEPIGLVPFLRLPIQCSPPRPLPVTSARKGASAGGRAYLDAFIDNHVTTNA